MEEQCSLSTASQENYNINILGTLPDLDTHIYFADSDEVLDQKETNIALSFFLDGASSSSASSSQIAFIPNADESDYKIKVCFAPGSFIPSTFSVHVSLYPIYCADMMGGPLEITQVPQTLISKIGASSPSKDPRSKIGFMSFRINQEAGFQPSDLLPDPDLKQLTLLFTCEKISAE